MAQNRHLVPQDANLGFVWRTADGDDGSHGTGIEKALKGEAGNDEWTLKCMYVSDGFFFVELCRLGGLVWD